MYVTLEGISIDERLMQLKKAKLSITVTDSGRFTDTNWGKVSKAKFAMDVTPYPIITLCIPGTSYRYSSQG